MVNFHLVKNVNIGLNQNTILEKGRNKIYINDMSGEMAKS